MTDEFLERGKKVREGVAGKGYRRFNKVDPDLSDYIFRSAFGDVWARPGLDVRTRRVVAMSMNIGSNHLEEWKLHAVYALRGGMTREELKEIALQAAVYCGVPASLDAFKVLDEAFEIYEREEAWKKESDAQTKG